MVHVAEIVNTELRYLFRLEKRLNIRFGFNIRDESTNTIVLLPAIKFHSLDITISKTTKLENHYLGLSRGLRLYFSMKRLFTSSEFNAISFYRGILMTLGRF